MSILIEHKLLLRKRTKIIATLGPASRDGKTIGELMKAGVDIFRLNLSHGEFSEHAATYRTIRRAEQELGRAVAVLADLGGPKIRMGRFEGGQIQLAVGGTVRVTTRKVLGKPGLVPSQYEALANDVNRGDPILLDDGNLELRVQSVKGTEIDCKVIVGGVVKDHKGMNLPGVDISAPSLTDKDRRDALGALELGVDFLALSFVRKARDVRQLRELIQKAGHQTRIIAKIEKPEALQEIDGILEAADAIMVARGDLGVELPPEKVPAVQDELIQLARCRNKPVIVATQMLESMIEHPRPTRAEVSDVAHAVMNGTDAVMLSGETAVGAHPVRAVKMMADIARQSESRLWRTSAFGSVQHGLDANPPISVELAVARATALLSRDLLVRAIVVVTRGGSTASMLASARPASPILGVTLDEDVCRRMNLLWGVVPVLAEPEKMQRLRCFARNLVVEMCLASPGEFILIVRGYDEQMERSAPTVTVVCV